MLRARSVAALLRSSAAQGLRRQARAHVVRAAAVHAPLLRRGVVLAASAAAAGTTLAFADAPADVQVAAVDVDDKDAFVRIPNAATVDDLDIVLYQYEVCPFCNKVRAFLDYHGVPYRVVEVNPVSKAEVKFSEYRKVPFAIINGRQINSSNIIINSVGRIVQGEEFVNSYSEGQRTWRHWVDDKFVHTLPPNIYRTWNEAVQAFEYISTNGNFSSVDRMAVKYAGAGAMYFVSKKLKKKHNIEDERAALINGAAAFERALGDGPFLDGHKTPGVGDLVFFGALRSIEGLQAFDDLTEARPRIVLWYHRLKETVDANSKRVRE